MVEKPEYSLLGTYFFTINDISSEYYLLYKQKFLKNNKEIISDVFTGYYIRSMKKRNWRKNSGYRSFFLIDTKFCLTSLRFSLKQVYIPVEIDYIISNILNQKITTSDIFINPTFEKKLPKMLTELSEIIKLGLESDDVNSSMSKNYDLAENFQLLHYLCSRFDGNFFSEAHKKAIKTCFDRPHKNSDIMIILHSIFLDLDPHRRAFFEVFCKLFHFLSEKMLLVEDGIFLLYMKMLCKKFCGVFYKNTDDDFLRIDRFDKAVEVFAFMVYNVKDILSINEKAYKAVIYG